MELLVATNNMHKVHEYQEMFKNFDINVHYPKELGIECDPDENGKSYEENSLIKAKALQKYTKMPIIADDSGLNVVALNNFPGIYSSRFASSLGGNQVANLELIKKLSAHKDKSAFFACVITLLNVSEKPIQFKGICQGRILDKPVGNNGFGYDPIFFSDEANEPFGTASEETKNKYSHRAKALALLLDYLQNKKLIYNICEKGEIK